MIETASSSIEWREVEKLLGQLVDFYKSQLLKCGGRIIPHLTSEDLLQPNDFRELEFNPHFRYEEGILCGIQTVQMALQALKKEKEGALPPTLSNKSASEAEATVFKASEGSSPLAECGL